MAVKPKVTLSKEDRDKLAEDKAQALAKAKADAKEATEKALADKKAKADEVDAKVAEENKAELAAFVELMKKGLGRSAAGTNEWVEGTLETAKALSGARSKFKGHKAFGAWFDSTGLKINSQDRPALIGFGGEPEVARPILLTTNSRSFQLIWKEHRASFKCYRGTDFEKKVSDYLKAADLSKEPEKARDDPGHLCLGVGLLGACRLPTARRSNFEECNIDQGL
jgi:hypothetical protein